MRKILKISSKCKKISIIATAIMSMMPVGMTMPSGAQIVAGNAVISQNGNMMKINQTSEKAIINWQNFNIATNEKVAFFQPNMRSITLNRVWGKDASGIYGQLVANGKIFLVNSNGILFAAGSQVKIGGLVASTLKLLDADFIAGKYNFMGNGGQVLNNGNLKSAENGFVALLGSQSKNEGFISAKKGTVIMTGGSKIKLGFNGDGMLTVALDEGAVNALVQNSNRIIADGGNVLLMARKTNGIDGTVINNSGIIRARSIGNQNGNIQITAEGNGFVSLSGKVSVSGKKNGESGGTVSVTGNKVSLLGKLVIDASGSSAGGNISIGGKGESVVSKLTTIDRDVTINASATKIGDGGMITVWSSETTNFSGKVTARGGSLGGNGGVVEVSGKNKLAYSGQVDLKSTAGKTGRLLLDPFDFVIAASGGDITGSVLGNQLEFANVTIKSDQGTQGLNGDILVNDQLSWNSPNSLELIAVRNITVNQAINPNGGGVVTMRSGANGSGQGKVLFAGDGKVSLGAGGNLTIFYNPVNYQSPTNYAANVSGGGIVNSYMLVNNITQLQEINSNLAGNYALNSDIDASQTFGWNGGLGFSPLGNASKVFSGRFDGQNFSISGLYINRPQTDYVGLFGKTSSSDVKNARLIDGTISGKSFVGGLVGYNAGNIRNDSSSGAVTGTGKNIGGLIGWNASGNVSESYSNTIVNGYSEVGGLVGYNNLGKISNSHSLGSVSAAYIEAGGLVGRNNQGTIVESNSSSQTNGFSYVGGLAGLNFSGTIERSFSSGAVSGAAIEAEPPGGGSSIDIGGLVGANHGGSSAVISNSYSNSQVFGFLGVGGLVGFSNGSIVKSYSTGEVHGNTKVGGLVGKSSGWISDSYSISPTYGYDFVGGLAGNNDGYIISNSYSAGLVKGSKLFGGLVGYNMTNTAAGGKIVDSYWDVNSSAQQGSSGGIGLSTAQMMNQTNYSSSWDYSNVWRSYDGYCYPLLKNFLTPLIVTSNSLSKTYDAAGFTGGSGLIYSVTPDKGVLGTPIYSGTSQGARNVGQYTVIPTGLYSGQQGYDITYKSGILDITPAPLTITAVGYTKTYDGTVAAKPVPLVEKLQMGDTFSGATESYNDIHAGIGKTLTVSSYVINDGNGGNNYTVKTIDRYDGVINPRSITIAPRSQSKTYGNALDFSSQTIGQKLVVHGGTINDPVTGLQLSSAGEEALAHIGNYAIQLDTGSLIFQNGYLSDYKIALNNAALTVVPRALSINARNQAKTYGEFFDITGRTVNQLVSIYGAAAGDPVVSIDLASQGIASQAPAGSYTLTPTNAVFASGYASDYKITYNTGILKVNPRSIRIIALDQSKVFGNELNFDLLPLAQKILINNQVPFDPIVSVRLESSGNGNTAIEGKYLIVPSEAAFWTGISSNYRIIYQNGILTVSR